jgi:hypothetical protein
MTPWRRRESPQPWSPIANGYACGLGKEDEGQIKPDWAREQHRLAISSRQYSKGRKGKFASARKSKWSTAMSSFKVSPLARSDGSRISEYFIVPRRKAAS